MDLSRIKPLLMRLVGKTSKNASGIRIGGFVEIVPTPVSNTPSVIHLYPIGLCCVVAERLRIGGIEVLRVKPVIMTKYLAHEQFVTPDQVKPIVNTHIEKGWSAVKMAGRNN